MQFLRISNYFFKVWVLSWYFWRHCYYYWWSDWPKFRERYFKQLKDILVLWVYHSINYILNPNVSSLLKIANILKLLLHCILVYRYVDTDRYFDGCFGSIFAMTLFQIWANSQVKTYKYLIIWKYHTFFEIEAYTYRVR